MSLTQFVRDSQQQSTWFLNWWVATICKADLGSDVYYVFFCLSLWLLASSWDPREVMRQNAGQCTRVLTPPPTRHSATLATTRSARPATLTRKVVTRGNVEAICYSFLPECRLNVTMYISQTEYHNQWYFNISNVDGLSQCSTTYDEKCETIYETSYERWVITFFLYAQITEKLFKEMFHFLRGEMFYRLWDVIRREMCHHLPRGLHCWVRTRRLRRIWRIWASVLSSARAELPEGPRTEARPEMRAGPEGELWGRPSKDPEGKLSRGSCGEVWEDPRGEVCPGPQGELWGGASPGALHGAQTSVRAAEISRIPRIPRITRISRINLNIYYQIITENKYLVFNLTGIKYPIQL